MAIYKIHTIFKLLLSALCIMTALQACMKENMDDCPPDESNRVSIVVRTHDDPVSRGIPAEQVIDNVYIYIFDESYNLTRIWSGGSYIYGNVYEATLNLIPATYHFIVWTNHGEVYTQPGEISSANDLIVAMQYPSGGVITGGIPDLHHGMLTNAVVVAETDNSFEIIIKPNTYRLNFTVEGLPIEADEYLFSVIDNHLEYTFDNSIIEGTNEIEYKHRTHFDGDKLTGTLKVLSLRDDHTSLFSFSNLTSEQKLHEDNLVHMIKTAYAQAGLTVDFANEFEFDITLKFDALLGITVTVNGWSYKHNPGTIG